MAWITNDGVGSTVNLSHTNGASAVFRLKELLKQAGWTVLMSSDGTTYNASGDQITSAGSGAGGMDNQDAWFRIEDPASLREYVFQRGIAHYYWLWHYSASDGFTGGSPDATTIPTASDMQGLGRVEVTSQVMFPTSGSWITHIAAQNAAHNGVYAWWLCCYTTVEKTFFACDAIDSTTTDNDNDPCVHIGTDDAPTYATMSSTSLSANPDSFRSWMRYGEDDEEWSGITGLYYTANGTLYVPLPTNNAFILDPHDSDIAVALPIHWMRHTSTANITGYKGASKYFMWDPDGTTYNYTDLVLVGSDYYLVWRDILLPGWPDATPPST